MYINITGGRDVKAIEFQEFEADNHARSRCDILSSFKGWVEIT